MNQVKRTHANFAKEILGVYADELTAAQKTILIEKLWAEGFFTKKPQIGYWAFVNRLRHFNMPPHLFLLFRHKHFPLNFDAIQSIGTQEVIVFLSHYLELTAEQRLDKLKTFPFFNPLLADEWYVREGKDIANLIWNICRVLGPEVEPGEAYFRFKRPEFVKELINHGKNGRTTIENATKQAVRFLGNDMADRNAMVHELAEWRPVAESVKKQTGASVNISQCASLPTSANDENHFKHIECNATMHLFQTSTQVHVIRNQVVFDSLKNYLDGDAIHMHIITNRDPRSLTDMPSAIILKSTSLPTPKVCAIFPQEVEKSLVKAVLEHVAARAPMITRAVNALRHLIFNFKLKEAKILNLQKALDRHVEGRSNLAVCFWAWDHDFCEVTGREWFTSQLTKQQEYHLAYYMDLITDVIRKIGLDDCPSRAMKCQD